jgi:hypothetical protein
MVRHSLEMSLCREEFFRLLPAAVGPVVASGDTIQGNAGTCRWRISLVRLADHRVGSVEVPRHRIDIVIEDCSEAEAEAFMERFRRGYLRGGG